MRGTKSEPLKNLAQVLSRLDLAGMYLKKEKCVLLLPSVSYLVHVISAEGKVQAIMDARVPQKVSKLKSFLGMVTYY